MKIKAKRRYERTWSGEKSESNGFIERSFLLKQTLMN